MSISALTCGVAGLPREGPCVHVGVYPWVYGCCPYAFFSFYCCTFQILGYFDYVFTAIFTIEIVLKVMAFLLIFTYLMQL